MGTGAWACVVMMSVFLPFSARAAEERDVADVLAEVQGSASARKSFSVTFEQQRYKALLKKTVLEKGRLDFLAPKSFRWEVSSPMKEIYVSNGVDFWKYSEAARHAQKLPASSGELAILDVFFRPASLKKDYKIVKWVAPEGAKSTDAISEVPPAPSASKLLVSLIPRAKSKQKALHLVVDRKSGLVSEIRIVHENGNRVRTAFGEPSAAALDVSTFEFVPPPGTAVDK